MRVAIIAAMGRNHVIGTDGGLPWHLPRDLKHFRLLTTGKPIVMGRKTLAAIGRPLPNRTNIVLTRQADFAADGVLVAHTMDEALAIARREVERSGADEAVVIGGGEVYRAFLPLADRLYLTLVDGEFEGTATFPVAEFGALPFTETSSQHVPADARNPHAVTFVQLDRVATGQRRSE
jgi:dihydrofolate reductase